VSAYPPPAQIAGQLLDAISDDLGTRSTRPAASQSPIRDLPTETVPFPGGGLFSRHVELVVIRQSVDIGPLAGEYERRLPGALKHMLGGRRALAKRGRRIS